MYYILLPDAIQPQLASTKKKKREKGEQDRRSRPRQKDSPAAFFSPMNVTSIFLFSFNTRRYRAVARYLCYPISGIILPGREDVKKKGGGAGEFLQRKNVVAKYKTKGINKGCSVILFKFPLFFFVKGGEGCIFVSSAGVD